MPEHSYASGIHLLDPLFICILYRLFANIKSVSYTHLTPTTASKDALHLTFYYPVNVGGSAAKLIEQICTDFNAENPDIVVEPVYTGNYDDTVTKIQTAVQGGTPPDVFVSLATQRFTMASTGMAMPLDELIAADGDEGKAYIGDFLDGFMEDSYVDGQISVSYTHLRIRCLGRDLNRVGIRGLYLLKGAGVAAESRR